MKPSENTADSAEIRGPYGFTPAEALSAFSARFLDAEACRSWILARLHPAGQACPYCRRPIDDHRRLVRWNAGERIQCADCGRFFTATTGTILAGKHFDPAGVYLLAVLVGLGVDNHHAAAILQCSPETVRLWRHRFEGLQCETT